MGYNTKNTYKGRFSPKNPNKYRGDARNIIYRSSWEKKVMSYLDTHPDILWWASEELVVPYISPLDNRPHRYFVDFVLEKKKRDGTKEIVAIEVKPSAQTKPPKKSKNTKKMINEQVTYMVNQAKWEACQAFCDQKGWRFVILTEKELGIK